MNLIKLNYIYNKNLKLNILINENNIILNNITYKFNKIIKFTDFQNIYSNNIINEIRNNNNFNNYKYLSYYLFDNCFDNEYLFSNLIDDIIFEFSLNTFPIRFFIFEINQEETIDLLNNNLFDFDLEMDNNLNKIKIYLNPIEKSFISKKNDLIKIIETNIKNIKKSSNIIFQIENLSQKVIIYNLCSNFDNKSNLFLFENEINLLELFFTNPNYNYLNNKKFKLIQFIKNNFYNYNKKIFFCTFNPKILNLSNIILSKNYETQIIKYNYPTLKLSNNIKKEKEKENEDDIIKTFEKLKIYNKFLFETSVRNHLRFQQKHTNLKNELKEFNNNIIIQIKTALNIILNNLESLE